MRLTFVEWLRYWCRGHVWLHYYHVEILHVPIVFPEPCIECIGGLAPLELRRCQSATATHLNHFGFVAIQCGSTFIYSSELQTRNLEPKQAPFLDRYAFPETVFLRSPRSTTWIQLHCIQAFNDPSVGRGLRKHAVLSLRTDSFHVADLDTKINTNTGGPTVGDLRQGQLDDLITEMRFLSRKGSWMSFSLDGFKQCIRLEFSRKIDAAAKSTAIMSKCFC